MELFRETVLGTIVTELAVFTNTSAEKLISGYQDLFGRYVDTGKLQGLLEASMPKENWKMIQRARRLALGDKEPGSRPVSPLRSVFSDLSPDGSCPRVMYYTPEELSVDNTIPMPGYKVKTCGFKKLRDRFFREMDLLVQSSPKDFDSFLIVLDTLMKKYLWSIPAAGKGSEDISLYDSVKTAVAITAALIKADYRDVPYIMAAGQLSGFQNYIFAASKAGAKGAAARLCSRSFYMDTVVSALAHFIIHKFKLPMLNILMLSHGRFYILLPFIKDAEQILAEAEKSAAEFLYKKFSGSLSFELVWERVSDEGILHYSDTITRLYGRIKRKKNQFLKTVLTENGRWNPDRFIVCHDLLHKSMCTACRSAFAKSGERMCANCEIDTEIGRRLPQIRQFSFSRGKGQYELLDGYYLNLEDRKEDREDYLTMVSDSAVSSGMYDMPFAIYHTAYHAPVKYTGYSAEIKTFHETAGRARGCKKLGILKMAVDMPDLLPSEELQRDGMDTDAISRLHTLYRMLELFFHAHLHSTAEKVCKDIYCVFSGRDRLLLIGPWSEMPGLAIEIHKKFREFTGFHPCITLSAAICTADGRGHISARADNCGKRLEEVRRKINDTGCPDKGRGSGIYFLGESMPWEDFEKQIGIGERFAAAIRNVGSEVVRRLGNYSRMYRDYLNTGSMDSLMFLPMLSADMAENSDIIRKNRWFENYIGYLYKKASNYRQVEKEFYYAEFSIKYALQLTEGTAGNEIRADYYNKR